MQRTKYEAKYYCDIFTMKEERKRVIEKGRESERQREISKQMKQSKVDEKQDKNSTNLTVSVDSEQDNIQFD